MVTVLHHVNFTAVIERLVVYEGADVNEVEAAGNTWVRRGRVRSSWTPCRTQWTRAH